MMRRTGQRGCLWERSVTIIWHPSLYCLSVFQAVRLGYMMGLDQKTFISISPPGEVISEDNQLNRERLAWTCALSFIVVIRN